MQNRGKSDKHTWKYWHEIPFLLLHAVLESKLETWVPGAHQGFHASSEHHLWHAGLPHDLMTHHASWWLLVTPCFILLRCQSCDVAACGVQILWGPIWHEGLRHCDSIVGGGTWTSANTLHAHGDTSGMLTQSLKRWVWRAQNMRDTKRYLLRMF